MRKLGKKRTAVLWAAGWLTLIAPVPAQAAEWTDYAVFAATFDEDTELTGVFNGYRVDAADAGKIVIMPTSEALRTASMLVIVESGGTMRELQNWTDLSDYGIAMAADPEAAGGHPLSQTAGLGSLQEGQTLYIGGIDVMGPDLDMDNLEASMALYETTLDQIEARDEPIFASISDTAAGLEGSAVFCENGDLAGILINETEFILSSALFGAEANGGSGESSFGSGSGQPSGSEGTSGSGGNSEGEDILNEGLLTTVTGGSSFFLALIPIMAVVFAVSFASYLNDEAKQKNGAGTGRAFAQPSASYGRGAVQIQGIGGRLAGKTFTLNGPLVFGRDGKQCSVVYPMDTKGISGVHCQLEADGDGAVLTDLGSSYGTFLRDGVKLSPNQPVRLKRGDEFYLAVRENTFRLL